MFYTSHLIITHSHVVLFGSEVSPPSQVYKCSNACIQVHTCKGLVYLDKYISLKPSFMEPMHYYCLVNKNNRNDFLSVFKSEIKDKSTTPI